MAVAVGIDLGTTFSAVAAVRDGKPWVIPNQEGAAITPSVVAFRDGAAIVGAEAKELQAAGYPAAAFFKRQMGLTGWGFEAAGREYSAIDLSALVLERIRDSVQRTLGDSDISAVITVPAYFHNPQREATIEAGQRAGLKVLQVVNEPTAAAIAYGERASTGEKLLLVYDLGGGTFDATLLRIGQNEIRVITSEGDQELGGKDWDDRILDFLRSRFASEFGIDPSDDRESFGDLLVRAEEAKKRLTSASATRISIVHGGFRGGYELERTTFEQLTADLMERTTALTRKVLFDHRIEPHALDGVLLVGGSTRMPMVHEFVTRAFGKPPMAGVNVDEAVALGAAILALETAPKRFGLAGRRRTIDVTNHSLGMIAVNETGTAYLNTIVLPKDREIPCVQSRPYKQRTPRSGSSSLEIFMTQGESELPADVTYLGRYVINNVPASASGLAVVDVEYAYDASGTVSVTAKDRASAKQLHVAVEGLPTDVPGRFLTPPQPDGSLQHALIYLAFDLSGSMSGRPLSAAKDAAQAFLQNTDLSHCSLGLMSFSDRVFANLKACQNARQIEGVLDSLEVGKTGVGNRADPFTELKALLGSASGPRFAVVLTDGEWYYQEKAVVHAQECKDRGIEIIAVGFGDADKAFLKKIASSDEASFFTTLGGLPETFSTIAQVMTESRSLGQLAWK